MAAPTIRLPYRGSHCNGGAVSDKIFIRPSPAWAIPGAVPPLLFSCGSKNVIPKGRTDSKASVIVVIMMTKMILFQPQPDSAFHGEMVYRVMDRVVTNVAEDQPRKNGGCNSPKR